MVLIVNTMNNFFVVLIACIAIYIIPIPVLTQSFPSIFQQFYVLT